MMNGKAAKPAVKIIIAAHKKYRMPSDDIYLPLHVGAEGKTDGEGNPIELGMLKDNTGEHISEKNASFCELTALYWAWKNLDADYIGLAHYRRHFSGKGIKVQGRRKSCLKKPGGDPFEKVLDAAQAEDLCSKYRMILPKKRRYYVESLYSHYAHTHYASQLDMTRTVIEELYPEYTQYYDRVVKQTYGYMFNMMIMEKELLDAYCSWLFRILFELEKRINRSDLSAYQGRCYGRISEIIFNVWLACQMDSGVLRKEEITEIPWIYTEKVNWYKKGAAFFKAKFFHVRYEGSF